MLQENVVGPALIGTFFTHFGNFTFKRFISLRRLIKRYIWKRFFLTTIKTKQSPFYLQHKSYPSLNFAKIKLLKVLSHTDNICWKSCIWRKTIFVFNSKANIQYILILTHRNDDFFLPNCFTVKNKEFQCIKQ